ncbi:hypothetical protein TI05_08600 [Achromatium sp. WMS3]|nr:hypothetical protein TI05_08600 [Achromatium sp. WMS3]
MRILWVEDYFTTEKQQSWLGDLNQRCKVVPIKDYSTAHTTIANTLEHYDLVILDINLENSTVDDQVKTTANSFGLENNDFLHEAGFHLFIQLLELGFSKERIIFFTGNVSETPLQRALQELHYAIDAQDAMQIDSVLKSQLLPLLSTQDTNKAIEFIQQSALDQLFQYLEPLADSGNSRNTYNQFKNRFRDARIVPPKAIKKGEHEQIDLQRWATPHINNPYLKLRRGIIDGCKKLATLTTDLDLQEYFSGLKRYLPLTEPNSTAKNSEYLHLARAIVHDWDNNGHNIPAITKDPISFSSRTNAKKHP